MSVFRAFIALDLSAEVQERLEQVTDELRQSLDGMPIRWVPSENIHLTLKFLGDVSVSNVEVLTKIIAGVAAAHQPFAISVGGMGVFPDKRRPRVIWIGVEGPAELQSVQRNIEVETARIGYQSESRAFKPHLTIGRVSRNAGPRQVRSITNVLEDTKIGFLGVVRIREVHLFRSDLQPSGAVYTRVFSAPLISKE